METKYINAMICFEMILDSYHSFQNTSFIIGEEIDMSELIQVLKKKLEVSFQQH